MHQRDKDWHRDIDDGPDATAADSWFRPVWEDLTDEATATPPRPLPGLPPRPSGTRAATDGMAETRLGALAAAQDALARLDAQAEMASDAVREGLIARLAYAEAAGLLAARGGFAHPLDLALRASERLGRRELHARSVARGRRSGPPGEADDSSWLDADELADGVLPLARLLQTLPAADDPFATAEALEARLGRLGRVPGGFEPGRLAAWRAAHWPDGRRPDSRPALLRAAEAASAWMESAIVEFPDAAQALAVAALLLRRARVLKIIPLPLWAGWTSLCAADDSGALPRLRGDVSARMAGPGGAPWPVVFLHLTAEAARAGARMLAGLRRAEAAGTALAAGHDRRSRLPGALAQLLRHPVLTGPALARQLAITPQAALRILAQLAAAGVITEISGRTSFRTFAIGGG